MFKAVKSAPKLVIFASYLSSNILLSIDEFFAMNFRIIWRGPRKTGMALVGLLFSVWVPACKAFNNLHMTLFSFFLYLLCFLMV